MTDLSFGEFGALSAKAFRGVGYSWGLTEEASFAAKRVAEFGLPAAEMVTTLLGLVDGAVPDHRMPNEQWQCDGDFLCPVCLGVSLADVGGCEGLTISSVAVPALIAPLLGSCLADGDSAYCIEWEGGRCETSTLAIAVHGLQPSSPTDIVISRISAVSLPVATAHRVQLDEQVLRSLERFAHRTYAPATEASRAGAGAAGDGD